MALNRVAAIGEQLGNKVGKANILTKWDNDVVIVDAGGSHSPPLLDRRRYILDCSFSFSQSLTDIDCDRAPK